MNERVPAGHGALITQRQTVVAVGENVHFHRNVMFGHDLCQIQRVLDRNGLIAEGVPDKGGVLSLTWSSSEKRSSSSLVGVFVPQSL